jgi:hypothetical protein
MVTKDEALKMAIEALPELISTAQCEFDSQHKAYEGYPAMYHRYGYLKDIADDGTKALQACKEALEQPAQEPVAWMDRTYGNLHKVNYGDSIPLYTHPAPAWHKLSDDEIKNKLKWFQDNQLFTQQMRTEMEWASIWFKIGVHWAEQALKEKNT